MPSERALIDRIAAGEQAAFATLIEPYRCELLRFAGRELGADSQLAEDVLQQALLNAYRALATGTCPENMRAWLFAIVRNATANARRSIRPSVSFDAVDRADTRPTLPEQVEQGEWIDWLMCAIGELPQRQRDALLGHAFEGRSHRELAALQATTVPAIKTLLHRARRRLGDLRAESALSILAFPRGRLAGAKGIVALAGQALAAATVTSAVLLALHAPGVGSVLAAGPRPSTGGTPAPASSYPPHGSHGTGPGHTPLSSHRIKREARRAVTACTHGKPLRRHFSPPALSYAAHHLSTDALEYTECQSLLSQASLRLHPRRHSHRRAHRPSRHSV